MGEWRTNAPPGMRARGWFELLEGRLMLSASSATAPVADALTNNVARPLTMAATNKAISGAFAPLRVNRAAVFARSPIARRTKAPAAKVIPTFTNSARASQPTVTSSNQVFIPPVVKPVLAGDANGDRRVDATDLGTVFANMGQRGAGLEGGDLNGDGQVDFADYQIIEANFGKSLPDSHYATVGINLDGIADYSTLGAFADLTRTFRPWGRPDTPYQPDPTIWRTTDNYPLEDAGTMTYARTYPDGTYEVSWDGQADLSFAGMGARFQVTSHDGDHWTGQLYLNHAEGDILNLYVKNVNLSDPLHDLHIISPDVDYNVSDTFRPTFLQKLANFNGPLRAMDWMQTNDSPVVDWLDRASPTRFSNASDTGVDYETIIKLANTVHRDLWINVPYNASDDYVRRMAALFRDGLDPSLKLYVEFSNEVWNTGFFQQARDNLTIARQDPDLTATDDFGRSAQEMGKQTARVSAIFREQFGDADFYGRVRPVLGAFIGTAYWAQAALDFISQHDGPVTSYVSAIVIAPYVGVSGDMASIDDDSLTLDKLFDWMNRFIDERLVPWIRQNREAADWYGLPLYAYEGGQSLQALNGQNEALKQAAQDDPRMGDVYRHLIRAWYDNSGGGIFENFALAAPYAASGYWGLLQSIDQAGGVKWDALMSLIGDL
ncbi:MAG TPA: dockerin type I domain-containing protein [Tepidisphaeraceae bacterium]